MDNSFVEIRIIAVTSNSSNRSFSIMLLPHLATFTAASLLYGLRAVSALSKIQAVGSKFFTEDGNQFYIKGEKQISGVEGSPASL